MEMNLESERTLATSLKPELDFGEPWQAEVFATALQLSRAGVFSWPEWVAAFSGTIATEPMRAGESIADAYYRQWMTTLEALIGERLCLSRETVEHRQNQWYSAYLNTRHGDPVSLSNAAPGVVTCAEAISSDGDHDHDRHSHHHHHHPHNEAAALHQRVKPAVVVKPRK